MTNPNDQAFPPYCNPKNYVWANGLTKLEYFSAMAMQGLLTDPRSIVASENTERLSKISIGFALNLIKELNATKEQEVNDSTDVKE